MWNYFNRACFIANVMPQRKLEITAAGIRTLAKSTEGAQKRNKSIISQQTEQEVHFANFSKQNSHVLKIKAGGKGICHRSKISS